MGCSTTDTECLQRGLPTDWGGVGGARWLVKPPHAIVGGAPVREHKSHARVNRCVHAAHVRRRRHSPLHLSAGLLEPRRDDGRDRRAKAAVHGKGQVGIDRGTSWSVCVPRPPLGPSDAVTDAGPIVVSVGDGVEGKAACLHQIDLVTARTAHRIRVAIMVARARVGVLPHRGEIHGEVAAAAGAAQINGERERPTDERPRAELRGKGPAGISQVVPPPLVDVYASARDAVRRRPADGDDRLRGHANHGQRG